MIRFYYNLAPNPMKVALCLEETGLPYEPIPVDTRRASAPNWACRGCSARSALRRMISGKGLAHRAC